MGKPVGLLPAGWIKPVPAAHAEGNDEVGSGDEEEDDEREECDGSGSDVSEEADSGDEGYISS